MMKKILIFLLISSCSSVLTDATINPDINNPNFEDPLINFPYFNLEIKFCVPFFDTSELDNPALRDPQARRITIEEKKHIFTILDDIKFTMNTPEYENVFLILDQEPISSIIMNGSQVSVSPGDVLDRKRMLDVMRNFSYHLTLKKEFIKNIFSYGNTSTGVHVPIIGTAWYEPKFPYAEDFKKGIHEAKNSHRYPNRCYWTNVAHSTVHHEIGHNMGFDHYDFNNGEIIGTTIDYIVEVWRRTFETHSFQAKYGTKLRAFRGYHAKKFAKLLEKDTVMFDLE